MAIRVALTHRTGYRYDRPVTLHPQVVRLRPAPHCRTPILSYSLRIEPEGHFQNWQQDPYSNYLARLVFLKEVRELIVTVDLVAEMVTINPFDFFLDEDAQQAPFRYSDLLMRELAPYLEAAPAGPLLRALVERSRATGVRTIDYIVDINKHLQQAIRYVIRHEPGVQTPEETLTLASGSCRDSAWLMVQLLRHLGLAARFASGYLIQLTPDVKPLDGPPGPEQDFTDLHAWAEVYLPGAGWVGLDPTSGLLAGEGHIPLACAADPLSAAPITGTFGFTPRHEGDRCEEEFRFHMEVRRLEETPRVTKPYSEEQWQAIETLGDRVDEELHAADVRLTMGGEPTFVSIDDRDSPEWTTAALGPNKRRQAGLLLRRLRDRLAPGALLHFGQGKWYPGESLPRWALGCFWRRDGEPIWEDPALVAEDGRDYGATPSLAEAFITELAERLGVDSAYALPGFEDVWYHLWRERRLPVNVDPFDSRLEDPEERRRLAKVFEQGLNHTVGYALPLMRRTNGLESRWESGRWHLRSERLYLLPGDSPMGYRLPLDSLPWEVPGERHQVIPQDPFAPRQPLPARRPVTQTRPQRKPAEAAGNLAPSRNGRDPHPLIRTALCVEPRGGQMYVFLPPTTYLEDTLDLVAAIEATAAHLSLPVLLEGYKPPSDARLFHLGITPDPGVVEVNIHPASTWQDLKTTTTILYEEAHKVRLGTEKFLLDGRHVGTGGGNHVVLGGPTPADSPLLRRPDLLRSLVACWHNHPSLSYIFSGLFLGPTSQAPRVDEARNDSLYELEIAFAQVPEGPDPLPWVTDRVFRHLLTDVTGNTHRTEFCIDKLYCPDTPEGRRGLLELRSFEMPPHARMSLAQQLLVRALVARFWQRPYRHRLARWGPELHDRFLLPHFLEQDFEDLLEEMQEEGYPLRKEWFTPHLEFRFPLLGEVAYRGVAVDLRMAAEPWHVLGEEATGSGTARYVDSSVERIQVKARGLTDERHIITCNGRRVPLHPTGANGEFVAGVRYRAWQPPSCLHPNIPVHTPLILDVLDTWLGRSLGGCQYHVAHPGGRSYETFPINAAEAESRRHARFFAMGHLAGPLAVPPLERSLEAPLTLDLRRPAPTGVERRIEEPGEPRISREYVQGAEIDYAIPGS